jgi:flagellar motor switch protein FliG
MTHQAFLAAVASRCRSFTFRLLSIFLMLCFAFLVETQSRVLGTQEAQAQSAPARRGKGTTPNGTKNKASKDDGLALLMQMSQERRVQTERELLGVIRSVLGSQLEPGQFLVSLTSDIDVKRLRAAFEKTNPGQRGGLSPSVDGRLRAETFFDSMPKDAFQTYLRRVNIRLFLDKALPESLVKVISNLVERQAGLRKERGDRLTVEKSLDGLANSGKLKARLDSLGEELSRARSEKEVAESKAENLAIQLRQSESAKAAMEAQKIQLETQSKVSDNIKVTYDSQLKRIGDELASARDEKKKLEERLAETERSQARKLAEVVKAASPFNGKPDNSFLGKFKQLVHGAEIPFTILPVGIVFSLVILIAAVLLLSAQNKRTRRIMEGVGVIAKALQAAGEASAQAGGGGGKELAKILAHSQKSNEHRGSDAAMAQTSSSAEGFVHARDAADEAWALLMEDRYLALSIMKDDLFDAGDGPTRFVSVLDAVGVAKARIILETLPRAELDELRKRDPQALPAEVGFRVVTELSRRAQTERSLRPAYFAQLPLDAALRATDAELAAAIDALRPQEAALSLLFVTSERALRVVQKLTRADKEAMLSGVPGQARAPEATARALAASLDAALAKSGNSRAGSYDVTGLLASVLERADASLRGAVQRVLEADASLRAEVKSRVLVFEDLLRLDREVIVELLAGLEVEDLAALFVTQDTNVAQGLLGLLPPKQSYSVREEMKRATSRPLSLRKAQQAGLRVQADVVAEARAMISEGALPPPEEWGQGGNTGDGQARRAG